MELDIANAGAWFEDEVVFEIVSLGVKSEVDVVVEVGVGEGLVLGGVHNPFFWVVSFEVVYFAGLFAGGCDGS